MHLFHLCLTSSSDSRRAFTAQLWARVRSFSVVAVRLCLMNSLICARIASSSLESWRVMPLRLASAPCKSCSVEAWLCAASTGVGPGEISPAADCVRFRLFSRNHLPGDCIVGNFGLVIAGGRGGRRFFSVVRRDCFGFFSAVVLSLSVDAVAGCCASWDGCSAGCWAVCGSGVGVGCGAAVGGCCGTTNTGFLCSQPEAIPSNIKSATAAEFRRSIFMLCRLNPLSL